MNRIIFFSFLMMIAVSSFAQSKNPFYDLSKDKPWIDSLKNVAKSVKKDEMYDKSPLMKTYMDANMTLGNYYEKMYEKQQLPDLSQALVYYHNITDLGVFLGWDAFLPLMAIRNNLCRKISSYYYFGKGTKKDIDKAIDYAARGMGNNKELCSFYSKRFFNSEETILNVTKKNDSVYVLKLNPFVLKNLECAKMNKQILEPVARGFSDKKFRGRYFYVVVFSGESNSSYENGYSLAETFTNYFVKEFHVDKNQVASEGDYDEKKLNTAYIIFKKSKPVQLL